MSVAISSPIPLREPGTGHLRVISSPKEDRVVIILRTHLGVHSFELNRHGGRDLRAALPRPKK